MSGPDARKRNESRGRTSCSERNQKFPGQKKAPAGNAKARYVDSLPQGAAPVKAGAPVDIIDCAQKPRSLALALHEDRNPRRIQPAGLQERRLNDRSK